MKKCQAALNDYKIEYKKIRIENHNLFKVKENNDYLLDKIEEKEKEIIKLEKNDESDRKVEVVVHTTPKIPNRHFTGDARL